MRFSLLLIASTLVISFAFLPNPGKAFLEVAAPEDVGATIIDMYQVDTDGDGNPDKAIIDAEFVTSHDRITIYASDGDMERGESWWEVADFRDETWVFDINADGDAQLIIEFRQESGQSVGYFWDDATGDGQVAYDINDGSVDVTESEFWTLRIESDSHWIREDGTLNYSMTFEMDGCGACLVLDSTIRELLSPNFIRDGDPDFVGGVEVDETSGIPRYFYRVVTREISPNYGFPRAEVKAYSADRNPLDPQGFAFWPFLEGPALARPDQYWDRPPYVPMNWESGRLTGAMVIDGYPAESGYHVNTVSQWQLNEINEASFENRMAYYDLASDQDGNPELHIRVAYTPPRDPYLLDSPSPLQGVRYSWSQSNTDGLYWDYKVGLAGMNHMDQVLQYGPYSVRSVEYEQLPDWIINSGWEWQVFLSTEDRQYNSSEGIYDWPIGITGSDQMSYLLGEASEPAGVNAYQAIEQGLRGEFHRNPGEQPWLYFSPVDRRLHLLGAERGVYNVDDRRRVEYRNLDGDDYIDYWMLYEEDELAAFLYHAGDHLMFFDGRDLNIIHAEVPHEAFRALPPADHDAWSKLGNRLDAHEREFPGYDLSSMATQFDGERVTIPVSKIRDLRLTESGYRLVVTFDFQAHRSDFAPREYIYQYNSTADAFSAVSLTPPDISVELSVADGSHRALRPIDLTVTSRNDGLDDLPTSSLLITAEHADQGDETILYESVDLPGRSEQTHGGSWVPEQPGEWTIRARVFLPDGNVAERVRQVTVREVNQPEWRSVLATGWPLPRPELQLLMMLGLVGIPAAGSMLLLRRLR